MQPWIQNEEWFETDSKLVELSNSPIKLSHTLSLSESISIHPPGIVLIRGPRQVGKSTFLRQFAIKCLSEGITPVSMILINAEKLEDRYQLESEISFFRKNHEGYCIILIDEITFIEKWWIALKILADEGALSDTLILATGSSSIDLDEGADLLPGRRGKRHPVDFELLPVSFKELSSTLSFQDYLLSGGFPHAISELLRQKIIPPYVYEIYASWITGLFIKKKYSVYHLPQLLPYVSSHVGSTTSVQKLSRECNIGSNHSAENYINVLEKGYSLLTAYWSAPDGNSISTRKNRKFYPFDPLLYHVFAYFGKGWDSAFDDSKKQIQNPEVCGKLVESVVASELRQRNGNIPLTYWMGNKEIDFSGRCLYEVKYRNNVSINDFFWAEKMLSQDQQYIVLTKNKNARKRNIRLIDVEQWLTENCDAA